MTGGRDCGDLDWGTPWFQEERRALLARIDAALARTRAEMGNGTNETHGTDGIDKT